MCVSVCEYISRTTRAIFTSFYRQRCAQRNVPVFKKSLEADFVVFRPAGATRCTNGAEFWHGATIWV